VQQKSMAVLFLRGGGEVASPEKPEAGCIITGKDSKHLSSLH